MVPVMVPGVDWTVTGMSRRMATSNDTRYRAVITWRKTAPSYDDDWRKRILNDSPVHEYEKKYEWQKTVDEWVEQFNEDDASIGSTFEEIIGHYDKPAPVKVAVGKAKRQNEGPRARKEIVSVQYQKSPLVWEDCDEKGN
jgi:hypothetical protein